MMPDHISKWIRRPMKSAPTACFSPANRRRSCLLHNAIFCIEERMQRADHILRKGSFVPALAHDRVILDFDRRHRRRVVLSTEGQRDVLLDLPQAMHIRDGDALVLGDSSLVIVAAEPGPLLGINA